MLVKEEGLEGQESRVVKNGRQKEFLEHGSRTAQQKAERGEQGCQRDAGGRSSKTRGFYFSLT